MSVDSIARGLYLPLSLIYFHVVGGLRLTTVGTGLTIAALLGLVGNPISGALIDRFGSRGVVIGCYLSRAGGFLLYLWVHDLPTLICAAGLVSLSDKSYAPALQALISELSAGTRRERMLALQRTIRNGGYGLGSMIAAGLLAASGVLAFHIIIVTCAVGFLVSAATMATMRAGRTPRGAGRDGTTVTYRRVLRHRAFLVLCLSNVPVALCYNALSGLVPIFAVYVLHTRSTVPGVLYALNTVIVTGAQLPVSRLQESTRRTRGSALGALVMAAACLGFASLVLPHRPRMVLVGLVLMVVVYTAAEIIHTTASKSLAADVGPVQARGRYLSLYQLSYSIAGMLAPGIFTAVMAFSPPLIWLLLAGGAGLGAAGMVLVERHLPAAAVRPPHEPGAAPPDAPPDRDDGTGPVGDGSPGKPSAQLLTGR